MVGMNCAMCARPAVNAEYQRQCVNGCLWECIHQRENEMEPPQGTTPHHHSRKASSTDLINKRLLSTCVWHGVSVSPEPLVLCHKMGAVCSS